MSRFTDTTAYDRNQRAALPIALGGTGATTPVAAADALGSITQDKLGAANGVARLGVQSFVPEAQLPIIPGVEEITLIGSKIVHTLETVQYTITNYDSLKTYTISARDGSISRNGAIITYTAANIVGNDIIKINDRSVTLTIVNSIINQPVITTPVNNAIDLRLSLPIVVSNIAFTGFVDTNYELVCETATDSNFTQNVVSASANNVNNLVVTLDPTTIYFLRARYHSNLVGNSSWSDTVQISTGVGIPHNEVAVKYPSSLANYMWSGASVDTDATGNRIVVGAYGVANGAILNAGCATVYVKSGNAWVEETVLFTDDPVANDGVGYSVAINDSGDRLVIGGDVCHVAGFGITGAAYVFRKDGASWVQEAKLIASNPIVNASFGYSVDIDANGTYIVIGAANDTNGVTPNAGAVYVFKRTGTIWTQETILLETAPVNGAYFGCDVSISGDGSRIAVGSTYDTMNTGYVYLYKLNGAVYEFEAQLTPVDGLVNDQFGKTISLSKDGSVVIIGAPYHDLGVTNSSRGAAYLFKRVGVTWSQETKLIAGDAANFDEFGTSVDISDDNSVVVISAVDYADGAFDYPGAAYLFEKIDTTWVQQYKISAALKETMVGFDNAVALSGNKDICVLGLSLKSDPTMTFDQTGAIYIFD
jgi:hypothetical protein